MVAAVDWATDPPAHPAGPTLWLRTLAIVDSLHDRAAIQHYAGKFQLGSKPRSIGSPRPWGLECLTKPWAIWTAHKSGHPESSQGPSDYCKVSTVRCSTNWAIAGFLECSSIVQQG